MIDYKAVFVKNEINAVFINPNNFRKILVAGKNRVIYDSINKISFGEVSAERNK